MKTAQTTLDVFLKIKNRRKQYFYLNWSNENPKAEWLKEKPSLINYQAILKWRDVGDIIICGYNESPKIKFYETGLSTTLSFMKSHLQKCIRRQISDKAVATALLLIKIDLNEFIRRLPIIMFEEVRLHSFFSTIIWFMVAVSKDYQPSMSQIEWLLGIVGLLCQDNSSDDMVFAEDKRKMSKKLETIDSDQLLTDSQKDLLYSIYLRISYGGMKGDMSMLEGFALHWQKRFNAGVKFEDFIVPFIPINEVKELDKEDYEIAAADFHCFPNMLSDISFKFRMFSREEIKESIWECSSKINSRKDNSVTNKLLLEIWDIIKDEVQRLQYEYIINLLTINN